MDVIEGMRTFVAVGQAGSFARAADRLGMSRALTSKYIGQLEERLGVRLLNRTTRSVKLTEAGGAYLRRCVGLLDDFDDMEASTRRRQTIPRGRIRIAAPATFGEMYLPEVISAFTDLYPDIKVDLSFADRYANLIEEGFDMAIRIGTLSDSSLISRKLTSTRLVICAAPDYVERHGAPEQPEDLAAHCCILDTNMREGERWPFMIDGKRALLPIEGRILIDNARAVRDFVVLGKGIGLCPTFLVGDDLRSGRLLRILTAFETPGNGVFALYPHGRHLSTKVRVMIDFLIERFPPAFD